MTVLPVGTSMAGRPARSYLDLVRAFSRFARTAAFLEVGHDYDSYPSTLQDSNVGEADDGHSKGTRGWTTPTEPRPR